MIFPAKTRHQVLKLCEKYPKGLLNYGFFEGSDFEDFHPVCKTVESFDELVTTSGKESMILKVAKRTSIMALDLVKLGPTYISQNVADGREECAMVFEEEVLSDEEEQIEDSLNEHEKNSSEVLDNILLNFHIE